MDSTEPVTLCNPPHDLDGHEPIHQPVDMQPVFVMQLVNTNPEQSD